MKLIARASCVVMNQADASLLTGQDYMEAAIRTLRDHGAKNVVVTSEAEVIAFLDRDWFFMACHRVERVARSVGAGNVFTATLKTFLAQGSGPRRALELSIAAAAMFLAGCDGDQTEESLSAFANEHPLVSVNLPGHITAPRRRSVKQMARPITSAASWLMALLTWLRVS